MLSKKSSYYPPQYSNMYFYNDRKPTNYEATIPDGQTNHHNPTYQQNYFVRLHKTKLCVLYKKGQCSQGSLCSFAHGVEELREVPNLYKTSLCIPFKTTNKCIYNDRCKFAHGESELRAMTHSIKNAIPQPIYNRVHQFEMDDKINQLKFQEVEIQYSVPNSHHLANCELKKIVNFETLEDIHKKQQFHTNYDNSVQPTDNSIIPNSSTLLSMN